MRRLHPMSAVLRVVRSAFQLGATGVFAGTMLAGPLELAGFWAVFALGAAGAAVGGTYGVARYLRFTYETEGDTLAVASGVFNRQERAIPLGRVQNVDVERDVVHRVLGLAVVRFETAGGGSTEAVLDAVDFDEARRLQEFVAAHDREAATTADEGSVDVDETGETAETAETGQRVDTAERAEPAGAEREELYALGLPDLLLLGLVTAVPAAPILVVVGTPVFGDLALGVVSATTAALGGPETVSLDLLPTYSPRELGLVAAVTLIEFGVATWLVSAALTVVEYYDFRLARVGDELRYERGLLNRYSGSIPVEKIQTVAVDETAPMRHLGYAGLSVETAGYGPGANDGQTSNTAIPLDDRDVVVEMAEDLGEFEHEPIERPPRRARRRYAVRYALAPLVATGALLLVDALFVAVGWWYAPLFTLPLAPVAGHLTWVNRGHATADDAFLARSGFWRRSTRAVPYYRVQTVIGSRSVFQRYRDLASVTADTASTSSLLGGSATAHDVDEDTARALHRVLRERLDEDVGRRRSGR